MFTYSALCFFFLTCVYTGVSHWKKRGKFTHGQTCFSFMTSIVTSLSLSLSVLFYLFIFLTGPLWKMLSPLPFQRAVNKHNGEGTNIILAINTAFGTKWNILKGRLHLKPCSLVHFPKIVGKINYIISRSLNNLWVEVHRLSQISQTALSFR